jgi:predicted O-methyltransferase YrrM
MLTLAKNIIENRSVENDKDETFPLHSETSTSQCEFIQNMMEKCNASICIEIGLAYGISSLFICESLAKKQSPQFISIDPFQNRDWNDIGLLNLRKAGFDIFTEFHSDFSCNFLPKLLESGLKIDFAYVDTSKVFDVVLLDAVYLTRLLKIGGIVVFDDCSFPGIKRMVRYISKWPHLTVVARHFESSTSRKRRFISYLAKKLPYGQDIFRDEFLVLDEDCGTNAHCIAFKKVSEDTRNWDWNVGF